MTLWAGCQREQIAVYRVPKEPEAAIGGAEGEAVATPKIQWKTPPGWEEQRPDEMSVATFSIPGDAGRQGRFSVLAFPDRKANNLNLVNVVRADAGLPPLGEDE